MRIEAALLAAAVWMGIGGASGCASIDALQREKVYRPSPGTLADWEPITGRDEALWIALPTAPGEAAPQRLRALWIPADDPAAPSVLYLHGTFRNVFQNRPKIAAIHEAGFSVLAVSSRGWGESTPMLPSEQSIVDDGEAAWAELTRRARDPYSRVIFGHSMGSGVAVELALRHREPRGYGALVLESAMTSMPDMVRDISPLGVVVVPLVTQQFASIDKIGRIDAPTWFLSGTADKTVPSLQTRRLYDAAPGEKHLELFEGGSHSGLDREFELRYRAVWHAVATTLHGEAVAHAADPAASSHRP